MRFPTWVRPLGPALITALLLAASPPLARATPEGQMTWAVHVSIAPTWFDPGEHPGIVTSMMIFYALHDALVKPMPGKPAAPSLAESWTVSPDGLVHEFVLRRGVVFHNGDPLTAEDVKFSFERYRGAAAKLFKEKVAAVEVVDPLRVRFRLKRAVARLHDLLRHPRDRRRLDRAEEVPARRSATRDSRRRPIGAGPYKLVVVQSRGRDGPGGARPLLAQDART